MSVTDRLDDALLLWNAGRLEGAFLNLLVAVASAARAAHPNESDREAFERFVASASRVSLSVEFRGKLHPIEHVFYKWLRCSLVHEASIPLDISFMPDPEPETLAIRAAGGPERALKLSYGWFHHLFRAVQRSVA